MKRKIVLFAICAAAILCNFNVNSIDNEATSNDVEQAVENIVPAGGGGGVSEVENVEDKKKSDNDDDADDGDYGDDDPVEVVNEPKTLPPHSVVVAVSANSSERLGKYAYDEHFMSPLELNENNYDWEGKLPFFWRPSTFRTVKNQ